MTDEEREPGEKDRTVTKSTTFTFNKETERFLYEAYPDAIGMSERIRAAIADARKVHELFQNGRLTDGGDGFEDPTVEEIAEAIAENVDEDVTEE